MGLLQSLPGVVAVITAEDIPGINDFTAEAGTEAEEVSFFALLNFLLMIYFDVLYTHTYIYKYIVAYELYLEPNQSHQFT